MIAKIYSCFPGTGKTYFTENEKDLKILDLDSSKFSWVYDSKHNKTTVRNPYFIIDYIDHIKANINRYDIILVSSHDTVVKAMIARGFKFSIIVPEESCKEEYIKRYKERGRDELFITKVSDNWHRWLHFIDKDYQTCNIIKLPENVYISDIKEKMI